MCVGVTLATDCGCLQPGACPWDNIPCPFSQPIPAGGIVVVEQDSQFSVVSLPALPHLGDLPQPFPRLMVKPIPDSFPGSQHVRIAHPGGHRLWLPLSVGAGGVVWVAKELVPVSDNTQSL